MTTRPFRIGAGVWEGTVWKALNSFYGNRWTNNVVGDADDRAREAKNNPNANYIASAAGAIASRVLRESEPELAAR